MMGRLTGVVAKANQLVGKINPHYDLTSGNIQEIHREYGGNIESICCAFKFGYLQGMKAAKAEMTQQHTI